VQGTLSGLRPSPHSREIGVAGFHLHFLRQDKQAGGHALDYRLREGRVRIAALPGFHVELPASGEFLKANLIDAKGKRRLNILVPTNGDPVLQRFDDQGKPLPSRSGIRRSLHRTKLSRSYRSSPFLRIKREACSNARIRLFEKGQESNPQTLSFTAKRNRGNCYEDTNANQ
jgi:Alpha-acetolactate decarboxylase